MFFLNYVITADNCRGSSFVASSSYNHVHTHTYTSILWILHSVRTWMDGALEIRFKTEPGLRFREADLFHAPLLRFQCKMVEICNQILCWWMHYKHLDTSDKSKWHEISCFCEASVILDHIVTRSREQVSFFGSDAEIWKGRKRHDS